MGMRSMSSLLCWMNPSHHKTRSVTILTAEVTCNPLLIEVGISNNYMLSVDLAAILHVVLKHRWFTYVQWWLFMTLISSRPIFSIILVGFWGGMQGVTRSFSAALMLLTLKLSNISARSWLFSHLHLTRYVATQLVGHQCYVYGVLHLLRWTACWKMICS